ncbi:HlyD family efflux transporter periplasmic adaptor subunit [Sulfidibacter corallicola]|uniref:HlyD family efflux transporter periplasmic adaptor subunit n=1 Tax=Sulfidibacter corallicola TaxID=2818388 RepID=A0A8A4TXP8_SULCO|nr:HlyD family efflux transporter periplasmic adaptor subunit [Sulfidibacter corallicola]QTD51305.1 HlyD family efflux transporter periplasmic adaptor subunit [Sulfidibacter corallicola]
MNESTTHLRETGAPAHGSWMGLAKAVSLALLLFLPTGCDRLREGSHPERDIYLVSRQPMQVTIEASGSLVSDNSIYIECPKIANAWSFRLDYLAPEGSMVRAGMPVARFADQEQQQQLQSTLSELDARRKDIEKRRLERIEALEKEELSLVEARAEADKQRRKVKVPEEIQARTELEKERLKAKKLDLQVASLERRIARMKRDRESATIQAENELNMLQSRVDRMRADIQKLSVTAARDGLIVYKRGWNGERVKIGDSVWFGMTLAEIPDLKTMSVKATIAEVDAGRVTAGQPVEIRLDANPDKVYRGSIRSLGRIFRAKSHNKPSTVFDAEVAIENPDPEVMRPGMTAKLKIEVDRVEDTLSIPRDALHFEGLNPYAKLIGTRWRGERRQPVEVGLRSGDRIQILAGLKEGDQVVLPDQTAAQGDGT